ncbi:MAG: helix-turn-helix domain-containing protein [Enterococcus lacertideformus]|uniref:Helix-turn-helix domain-containing protein n=1 Tax=Enterococcus lacertideformus TaxID=2771493 RepID=A0A931AWZ4_9ENTE|nr:helix-turn-helix domain-containing protein [Enterococcus lacertideformus]
MFKNFIFLKALQKKFFILFSINKKTLSTLAIDLYISPSKLFNILKFLEKRLSPINLYLKRSPYITMEGNIESILVLYNLYLQNTSINYDNLYHPISTEILTDRILNFLDECNIKIESSIIFELRTWIITVMFKDYLQKFSKYNLKMNKTCISPKSPVIKKIENNFFGLNNKKLEEEQIILILIFLLSNMNSLHFKSFKWEQEFFLSELITDYIDKNFIFSILCGPYNVSTTDINTLSVKIEMCIHYAKVLYPYYFFYSKYFSENIRNLEFSEDINRYLKKNYNTNNYNPKWILILITYMINSFQKYYIDSTLKIAFYSVNGNRYEEQYCNEIKKAINIVPYTELNNSNADILLIDNIKLLKNIDNYEKYVMIDNTNLDSLPIL